MAERLTIQIKDNDNVVVAVHDLPAGTKTESGVVTRDPIPQAHKDRTGGYPPPAARSSATRGAGLCKERHPPPAAGSTSICLDLPEKPGTDRICPGATDIKTPDQLPTPPRTTWMGYRNIGRSCRHPQSAGIVTTVQCAAGVVKVAVERIKKELLPKYPNVDGVVCHHSFPMAAALPSTLRWHTIPIRAITNCDQSS